MASYKEANIAHFNDMKKTLIFTSIALVLLFSAFKSNTPPAETHVLVKTSAGNITLKLYNETPLHRDNFIKLVNSHFYDSVLFHRVIQSFMIQAGDPNSKKAVPGVMLGDGDIGYTIPAEFVPSLFHRKGVLAAARQGDNVNPKKESSGCQFYIVQGKAFTDADLNMFEERINMPIKQKLFNDYISKPENEELKQKFIYLQANGKMDSVQILSAQIEPFINEEFKKMPHFKFSEEQRKAYTTVGGAPHLDGSYTVYGEVVEGMEVVDKIAAEPVDGNNRPKNDVKIISMEIIKVKKKSGKKNKGSSK